MIVNVINPWIVIGQELSHWLQMTRINYIIIIIIITTISIIILHVYIPIGPRRRCIVFRAQDL